jgi:hypothetical protein
MTATQNSETLTDTREAWLNRAAAMLAPRFEEVGMPLDLAKVRIAVGFGPTGARKENATILGVTLHSSLAADGVNEIWISPEDADTVSMLATLVHELIHAADDNQSGHRGDFAEAAVRLGLEGPMTATTPTVALGFEFAVMASELGPYPGAKVDVTKIFSTPQVPVGPDGIFIPAPRWSSGPRIQTNRQIRVECVQDECPAHLNGKRYAVRLSRAMLAIGAPKCPAGHDMEE